MGNCAGNIMSNVIYFSEKFSMFLSFTMLISCSIICMVCMLAFGIGLGYNYSYVDYRSKHMYIAGTYKKERPTNYHGPGHYKPTTIDPRYTTQPKRKKKTTQRWWYGQRRGRYESQEPEVVEYTNEKQEDLPHLSPVAMAKNVIAPQLNIGSKYLGPKLEGLYFSTPKVKLRFTDIPPQDDSTTEITTVSISNGNDTEVEDYEFKEEAGNASNDSDVNFVNATKYVKEPEAIPVNVTKTSDSAAPFVLKTMMHQDQLMKWLSRLQDANKTFAVHVITN